MNMLLILLLVSRVATEWVEIAQTHYRKEPPRRVTVNYKETTEANRIYSNYSIEQQRHRGVTRFPNVGNVMRVQYPTKTGLSVQVSRPEEDLTSEEDYTHGYENLGVRAPNIKSNVLSQTQILQSKKKSSVQDEMRILFEEINGYNAKNNFSPRPDFNPTTEKNYNKASSTFKVTRIKNSNSDNRLIEKQTSNGHNQDLISIENNFNRNSNIKRVQIKPTPGEVKRIHSVKQSNDAFNIHETSEVIRNEMHGESKNKDSGRSENKIPLKVENSHQPLAKLNKVRNSAKLPESMNSHSENVANTKFSNKTADKHSAKQPGDASVSTNHEKVGNKENIPHKTKQNDENAGRNKNDDLTKKTNTMEIIWKFMKLVSDNISRNTRRSVRSKMRYLEDLRNNILANIEDQIDEAWPDDDSGPSRRKRSPRGHVEFPSSESALMTISFLTFAVFLIKLVLQVIHTYKNKTMMVTPAVVAAVGRTAATLKDRRHH